MDLAIGAKNVFVTMSLFAKDGSPKLVPLCSYPITGMACVSRIYTDFGVFAVRPDGVRVVVSYGISVDDLRERLAMTLHRI
jgi:3-oxoadipate CoA-transferase beta subunit